MFCEAKSSGLVITKKMSDISQQFDSLSFSGNDNQKGNKQVARLPIAPMTAKILERGSFHEETFDADFLDGVIGGGNGSKRHEIT